MDYLICETLMFQDKNLDKLVCSLNTILKNRQGNFAELCTVVSKIYKYCKDNSYLAKDNEYYNATKLLGKFGFERKYFEKLVRCYDKFITDDGSVDAPKLKSVFLPFSPSKLFEFLSISNEQLLKDIDKQILKPSMTEKEIRQYVKSLKGGEKEQNKVLEEPSVSDEDDSDESEFYNVNKHYDLNFFESCDKEQLVSIVWTMQLELEKLRMKKNRKDDIDISTFRLKRRFL